MFKKIINILTIEETTELSLESYTLDFEIALQNAFSTLLLNRRCVGCYYHYCRNLREKAREYKLLVKEKNEYTKFMLKEIYVLPFVYNDNKHLIKEIKNKYYKKD